MKTQPIRELNMRDELLLSEEVHIVRAGKEPLRVLIPYALVHAANAVAVRAPFEIRRLNSDLLASFDGEKLTARSEIQAALPSIKSFLDHLSELVARDVERHYKKQLNAQAEQSPKS